MKVVYDKHPSEWKKCLSDAGRIEVASTWMRSGTLDRWRHSRRLSFILPLIAKGDYWLTLGDGRYGTDAHYLLSHGVVAHASDISDTLLKIGHDQGFIGDYSLQNSEDLSFADEAFDYVLIKEAFHHFPRPWIALHEAFRVCRKGVVLIEPNDNPPNPFVSFLKVMLRMDVSGYGFEPVGNFIYGTSRRELEKFLLGMHYRYAAFRGVNCVYRPGFEFVLTDSKKLPDLALIFSVKAEIVIRNFLCRLGLFRPRMLVSILFKEAPSSSELRKLAAKDFLVRELPLNPYL